MFSTEDLRFFLLLVKRGSLAETARELNVTPPAVTQRLRSLEDRIGLRLLERSTRRMGLTDEGALLVTKAQGILDSLDAAVDEVRGRKGLVAGELRVQASLGFGRRFIAPAVREFHEKYPSVKVSLSLSDRPNRVALASVYDVIIHIGELGNSSQVAIPIAPNGRVLCAAPGYVASHGAPANPADLDRHSCLAIRENDEDVTLWRFTQGRHVHPVRIAPQMACNDGDVIRQWALAGKGIMLRSEWDVADHIKQGRLVRLLPEFGLPSADIVALLPAARGSSARTRTFIDLLRQKFRPVPHWRRAK